MGRPARQPVVKFVRLRMLAAISHNVKAKLSVFVRAGSGLALAIVSGDQLSTPGCAQPLAAKLLLPSHPHGIFGKAAVRLAATSSFAQQTWSVPPEEQLHHSLCLCLLILSQCRTQHSWSIISQLQGIKQH